MYYKNWLYIKKAFIKVKYLLRIYQSHIINNDMFLLNFKKNKNDKINANNDQEHVLP